MSYADGTIVPVERSRSEIERIMTKYGANQFASGWGENMAVVTFRMRDRMIRIEMPLPFVQKTGKFNTSDKVARESRRRWRALVLYVKAKMESVESEIVSFEEAFMAHIVLPGGETVGRVMQSQIAQSYQTGKPPALLGYDG